MPISTSARQYAPADPTSAARNVHLVQLNPDKNEADTDIVIIAIHGLDNAAYKNRKPSTDLPRLCFAQGLAGA